MTAHQCNSPGLYPIFLLPSLPETKGPNVSLQLFGAVILSLPPLGSCRCPQGQNSFLLSRNGTASPHLRGHPGLPG